MLELVVQKCNTYLDYNCWPTVIFSWPTTFSEQCYFYYIHYKWFEPRSHILSRWSMIVQVSVVLRRTVCGALTDVLTTWAEVIIRVKWIMNGHFWRILSYWEMGISELPTFCTHFLPVTSCSCASPITFPFSIVTMWHNFIPISSGSPAMSLMRLYHCLTATPPPPPLFSLVKIDFDNLGCFFFRDPKLETRGWISLQI